jgi:hypothetical protein
MMSASAALASRVLLGGRRVTWSAAESRGAGVSRKDVLIGGETCRGSEGAGLVSSTKARTGRRCQRKARAGRRCQRKARAGRRYQRKAQAGAVSERRRRARLAAVGRTHPLCSRVASGRGRSAGRERAITSLALPRARAFCSHEPPGRVSMIDVARRSRRSRAACRDDRPSWSRWLIGTLAENALRIVSAAATVAWRRVGRVAWRRVAWRSSVQREAPEPLVM